MVNAWGPAIIVCLTVLVGIIVNNRQIDRLDASLNKRIDDFRTDLYKYLDAKFKAVEDRLEKLENPKLVK